MRQRVFVWPAAGGPAITFDRIDELVTDELPEPLEDALRMGVSAGARVLYVNPAFALAVLAEPAPSDAEQEDAR